MAKVYYFDNNATTRIAPQVLEAMLPFLTDSWANPSSGYQSAHQVAKSIRNAREQVAALVNADPTEIIFTSCGTESNNAAIHSALQLQPDKRHIITTAVEHSAILKHTEVLETQGYEITYLPVSPEGALDLKLLEEAIRPDTAIVSIMWANNETGVLFPVAEAAEICRSCEVLFHTDAVQAGGKLKIDVNSFPVDFLSLSAHKLYAPKGVGLLYVRRSARFSPLILGGHQERGRRGGTENVAGIVAFGRAAELAEANLAFEQSRVRTLRDRLEAGILQRIPNSIRNGADVPRLPNTTSVSFAGVEAEAVLLKLDQLGYCASTGAACTTGTLEPSHVLTAMQLSPERARGTIRFSLGIYNQEQEVDDLLTQLPSVLVKLRALSARS